MDAGGGVEVLIEEGGGKKRHEVSLDSLQAQLDALKTEVLGDRKDWKFETTRGLDQLNLEMAGKWFAPDRYADMDGGKFKRTLPESVYSAVMISWLNEVIYYKQVKLFCKQVKLLCRQVIFLTCLHK